MPLKELTNLASKSYVIDTDSISVVNVAPGNSGKLTTQVWSVFGFPQEVADARSRSQAARPGCSFREAHEPRRRALGQSRKRVGIPRAVPRRQCQRQRPLHAVHRRQNIRGIGRCSDRQRATESARTRRGAGSREEGGGVRSFASLSLAPSPRSKRPVGQAGLERQRHESTCPKKWSLWMSQATI